jgi:hypothetical protein
MQLDLVSRVTPSNNWLVLPVIGLIIVLIIFKNNKRPWGFIVKSYFSYYYFRQIEKDENYNQQPQSALKFLSSILLLSIAFYLFNAGQEKMFFLQIAAVFLAFNFCYYLFIVLSEYFFERKSAFNEYWLYYKHYINSSAILLVPFIFYLIFYPHKATNFQLDFNLYSILLLALATLFSSRIFNVFKKGLQLEISLFHLILYLCTLEILPLFIFLWFFNLKQ